MREMRASPMLEAMDSHHLPLADAEPSGDAARKMFAALLRIPLGAATILAVLGLVWLWLDLLT